MGDTRENPHSKNVVWLCIPIYQAITITLNQSRYTSMYQTFTFAIVCKNLKTKNLYAAPYRQALYKTEFTRYAIT
jgi:hypothetical protein